ncbi:MAG: Bro-N domain-containing protein [archaeon]
MNESKNIANSSQFHNVNYFDYLDEHCITIKRYTPIGELTVIVNPNYTTETNVQPYFVVAKELADKLDYHDISGLKYILDPQNFKVLDFNTLNKIKDLRECLGVDEIAPRGMMIISEPGLYHILQQSKKPEAVEFRNNVNSIILPNIRQYGEYSTREKESTDLMSVEAAKEMAKSITENFYKKLEEFKKEYDDRIANIERPSITFKKYGTIVQKVSYDFDQFVDMIKVDVQLATNWKYTVRKSDLYNFFRYHGFIEPTPSTRPTADGINSNMLGLCSFPLIYSNSSEIGVSIKTVIYEEYKDVIKKEFTNYILRSLIKSNSSV